MPFAKAATTASIGTSSIIDGIVSDSISIALRLDEPIVKSPTFSPLWIDSFDFDIKQFILFKTSTNPILDSLSNTLVNFKFELLLITAKAAKKAAEDGSEGIEISIGFNLDLSGWTIILLPSLSIDAPIFFNIISEWFLVGIISLILDTLFPPNAEKSIHDFTCALATFISKSIALVPSEASIDKGNNPLFEEILHPIDFKGVIIRFIGLFDNDSSPINENVNFWEANNPATSLVVVPELPQSRSLDGEWSFFPFIMSSSSLLSIEAPQSLKILIVDWRSAPSFKFLT